MLFLCGYVKVFVIVPDISIRCVCVLLTPRIQSESDLHLWLLT